jgi:integrase
LAALAAIWERLRLLGIVASGLPPNDTPELIRMSTFPQPDNSVLVRPAIVASGQQNDARGGVLARRRYQCGTLKLRGKRNKVWTLRWREDQVEADGTVKRVERKTVLGTLAEFPTKKLARRRADILLSRVNRPDYRPGKVISFEEFTERWKEHCLSQQKPSSVKVANSHLRTHLIRQFGKLRLDQIGQEDVQRLVTVLGKRLGRHTILNILGTLFSILRTARKWGYVVNEIHQTDLAISSSKPSRPGKSFTAEQVIAIIKKAEEPWHTIFSVAALTGMRPGEVLGLAIDDLDFGSKQIFIRQSAWYSQLLTPKSKGSVGVVPMPADLEDTLRGHLLRWKPNPKRLLFCNRRGNPYSENKVVQKRLWPILDELKFPRCGMHAFRHAHATLSIANGASPKTV